MSDLQATGSLIFTKGLITPYTLSPATVELSIAGKWAIKNGIHVTAATTLGLGSIGTLGLVGFRNTTPPGPPPSPAPVITQGGTPDVHVVEYAVVAHFADGSLSIGLATTSTSADVLNGTDKNIVTWASVGAATYDIYRLSTDGSSPTTLGLLAAGVTSPYNDTGIAGDDSDLPDVIFSAFELQLGSNGSSWPNSAFAGDPPIITRWNGAAIHVQPALLAADLEYLLIEK
jgi:hypothetical protein